jgi:hypothetical protein
MRTSLTGGLVFAAALILSGPPAFATSVTLEGVNALPGTRAKAAGTLIAAAGRNGSEALDFVLMRTGKSKPILKYDVELTKQLHVIAISDDFMTFLHDHVTRVGKAGHFRLNMAFPQPGLYHVYADSTPTGIGQQVLRFDLPVGTTKTSRQPAKLNATGLRGSDGPYSAKFDGLDLIAGQESSLTLHITKWGQPASDLKPFLGVAAHAVFIDTSDLSYVHVHATPSSEKAVTSKSAHEKSGMSGMGGMGHMDAAHTPPMSASAKVTPDLSLHVEPPKAGTYKLWIQFIGAREVRTVPFIVIAK